MRNKILLTLFVISGIIVTAQAHNDPSPAPGCPGIESMGMDLPSGQNSQHYVSGHGDDGTGCSGNTSSVGSTPINPGEYAFARFEADILRETHIDDTDYYIFMSNVLQEMPIGGRVKVVEVLSGDRVVADISFVKKDLPLIKGFANGPGLRINDKPNHRWRVKIRWYGADPNTYTTHKYFFAADDRLSFNHVLVKNDQAEPHQYISINNNEIISENPYSGTGISQELTMFHMGFIDTNVQLVHGDRLIFNVNWIYGPDPI